MMKQFLDLDMSNPNLLAYFYKWKFMQIKEYFQVVYEDTVILKVIMV